MPRAYAHGGCSTPLLGETIGERWARTVAEHGDRDALVCCAQDIRWTYAELDERVERCARGLLRHGVGRGDRLAMWGPNSAEWPVVQLAAARVGAILVTVNPSFRAAELGYVLRHSRCSLLIHARGFRDVEYGAVLAELPAAPPAISLDEGWDRLLALADDVPPAALREREAAVDVDDPATIQYTSGTTGPPKGVVLSHHGILNNGFFVARTLGYGDSDRVCVPLPLFHAFALVGGTIATMTHGACMVVPSAGFDAAATLRAVDAERCTSLYGVPTMFLALLGDPSLASVDLTSLRTGIISGAPCPVELVRRVCGELHLAELAVGFGMTELSPCATLMQRDDPVEKRVSTVGRVQPHVEVEIVDPATGATLQRGEQGELCVRGYLVMLGYWDDEPATRRTIDDARWLHTGDLATMDDDGYLNIVGRSKDVIIRGGENISPREIEEQLQAHPDVSDAQVVGLPDERYGEVVCAWVVLRPGATLDEDAVRAFCRLRLADFKVPRHVRFVEEFPLTATGKIQKFRIREIEIRERGLVEPQTA